MGGRNKATIAAAITGMAAMAIVPTWTDAARKGHHGGHDRGRTARNVIVLQGDGMATAQRDLIRLVTVGNKEGQDLEMNRLEHTGLVHTDPADPEEAVTDSAAAATAFSTGYKSFNGAIGVDAQGRPQPTLLEDARRMGKATGLVTTSQVTDATPAAYGAHVSDRAEQSEIARQYLEGASKPDVILGGGEDFWFPPGTPGGQPDHPATDPTEESKGDRGNLVERAQELGYNYVSTREGLADASGPKLLGLFANEEMFEHREEGDGDLYDPLVPLPEMAAKALDVLSRDPDGMFVLIEEEGIDEMAHENNTGLMIKAGEALDQTVALAVEFARRHRGTLIVVQGDHETGGLTIENPDDEDESGEELSREDGPFPVKGTDLEVFADWTTGQHTGADTPITASGPGSKRFDGVIDNTDVHDAIEDAMRRRR
jgi:alkaline phosphatase